jgi:hypothetical protein
MLKRRRIMLSRMIWNTSSEGPHGAEKVFRKQPLEPLPPGILEPSSPNKKEAWDSIPP